MHRRPAGSLTQPGRHHLAALHLAARPAHSRGACQQTCCSPKHLAALFSSAPTYPAGAAVRGAPHITCRDPYLSPTQGF